MSESPVNPGKLSGDARGGAHGAAPSKRIHIKSSSGAVPATRVGASSPTAAGREPRASDAKRTVGDQGHAKPQIELDEHLGPGGRPAALGGRRLGGGRSARARGVS